MYQDLTTILSILYTIAFLAARFYPVFAFQLPGSAIAISIPTFSTAELIPEFKLSLETVCKIE